MKFVTVDVVKRPGLPWVLYNSKVEHPKYREWEGPRFGTRLCFLRVYRNSFIYSSIDMFIDLLS